MENNISIHDVCDYIIHRLKVEDDAVLSNLKLQKLLYYAQAWYLAIYDKVLFPEKFQAWVHGPVSRVIYDRFKQDKSLYSDISLSDMDQTFDPNKLSSEQRKHIEEVLDVYAKYTAMQLELMTHEEDPWIEARKGYLDTQRCEVEISEKTMTDYYRKRLGDGN